MSADGPRYVLVLRALADPTDPLGIRRLRHVLKGLLRGYRMRAESCEPWTEPKPPKPAEDATPAQEPRKRRRLKPETVGSPLHTTAHPKKEGCGNIATPGREPRQSGSGNIATSGQRNLHANETSETPPS